MHSVVASIAVQVLHHALTRSVPDLFHALSNKPRVHVASEAEMAARVTRARARVQALGRRPDALETAAAVEPIFREEGIEHFVAVAFSRDGRAHLWRVRGFVNEVLVPVNQLSAWLTKCDAKRFVAMHSHPRSPDAPTSARPSGKDRRLTAYLRDIEGYRDHVVVAPSLHDESKFRAFSFARGSLFDVEAIWALDRFGRSMVGNLQDVLELDRLGVRVVSVRESWLDTSGPMRNLLLAIFSWVAEQERTRLVERTKAGMQRAAKHGTKSGLPIGRPLRMDRPTLARALTMRAEGRSVRQIAVALKIPRSTLAGAMAEAMASENPHRETTPSIPADSSA